MIFNLQNQPRNQILSQQNSLTAIQRRQNEQTEIFKSPFQSSMTTLALCYLTILHVLILMLYSRANKQRYIPIVILLYFILMLTLMITTIYKVYRLSHPLNRNSQNKIIFSNYQYGFIFQIQISNYLIKKCRYCNIYQTNRIHHCRKCERCFAWHDHHCQWLGCCIMGYNYKWYLLFLSLVVCDTFGWLLMDIWIIKQWILIQNRYLILGLCIFGGLQVVIITIYSAQLLIFHLWLIYHGISTREYYQTSIRRESRFNNRILHQYANINQLSNPQNIINKLQQSKSHRIVKKQSILFQYLNEDEDRTQFSLHQKSEDGRQVDQQLSNKIQVISKYSKQQQ